MENASSTKPACSNINPKGSDKVGFLLSCTSKKVRNIALDFILGVVYLVNRVTNY